MIMRQKIFSILALLCLMVSGASADPQEELLTTVTATGLTTYTQTVEGIVTVTPNASDYYASGGWYYMGSVTVEPVSDEYTITRCVFIDPYESLEDDLAPFIVSMYDNTVSVETKNGVASKDMSIKTIEVYGYKNSAGPTTQYNLTLATGTEDATSWQGKAGEGEYQALPLEGVAAGTAVSIKYNGTKMVKSVKAKKKAPTATIALPSGSVKTFAVGETMALLYNNGTSTVKAESRPLTAADIINSKSATFTFDLATPDKTKNVTYVYPAAMANDDGTLNYSALATQDGTQATISNNLLAAYTAAWNGKSLPAGTLVNQFAVLALTLQNGAGTKNITSSITTLTVSDGTNTYTVSRSAAAGPIYVAIQPTSDADIEVNATDGTKNYTKTLTGETSEVGCTYDRTLKMLTLIEWNQSELEGMASMYGDDNGSRTLKGVTLTKTSGTFYTYDIGKYFGGVFQFSSILGNLTKIELTTSSGSPAGDGWSGNVWTGTAANIVNIAESGFNATNIVFTIEEDIVAVSGITLNKSTLNLTTGQNETLIATVLPAEADNKTVTWSSDNTSVATVDATGKVTAVADGTATITATASGFSATCVVTVASPVLTSFVVGGKASIYYFAGETWGQAIANHSENAGWAIDSWDEISVCYSDGSVDFYLMDGDYNLITSDTVINPSSSYEWWEPSY